MKISVIFLLLCTTELLLTQGALTTDEKTDHTVEWTEHLKEQDDKHGLKGDTGRLSIKVLEDTKLWRKKRNTDGAAASFPAQAPQFSMPNVQSSYFLGQCLMCPPGAPGPIGPTGLPGIAGRDGIPGQIGRDGRDQNVPSYAGVGDSPYQDSQPHPKPNVNRTIGGVTYVRWGRTTCPEQSVLVYEGVMAGGNRAHKGAGANYLCLPLVPSYGTSPLTVYNSYIYGTEYHNTLPNTDATANVDAPCAVCLAPQKHEVLMIPAWDYCPDTHDWTLEYIGYVVAEFYSTTRSEYICLDGQAEGIPRTTGNEDNSEISLVTGVCNSNGGLPCPPYRDSTTLTCVVCTI